jgi:trans-aconitate 2-methyltransferase
VLPGVDSYYARLKPHVRRLDIWHTIYNHPLDGVDGIIAWLGSTGLRPFLAPLEEGERAGFLAEYRRLLAGAYPVQEDGKVLLRFPRLFVLGVR